MKNLHRDICDSLHRILMLGLLFLISPVAASAQEIAIEKERHEVKREEMHIRYRVSKNIIDKDYMNNQQVLERIVEWAEEVKQDSMVNILSVEFCGAVSPEGSTSFNRWLSMARLTALEKHVRQRVYIPEEIIVRNDHYIAWDELKAMVLESDMPNKEEIMAVLNSENTSTGDELDSRIGALKALDNGQTWDIILKRFFIHMRNAYMVIVTEKSEKYYEYRRLNMVASLPPITSGIDFENDLYLVRPEPEPVPDKRYMYVKSNLMGLGLLMGNLGVEFDLGRYFSISIPIYYSALDYFKPTLKFRTLATQPELRVWPKTNKDGLFFGAHMGFAYYNFAFDGDWRYQDHDGKCPTLGGGLSIGYRLPISRNKRWKLELGIGAGIYPLYYDRFHNLENVKDGQLFDTHKKTYIGIDNVQVGISYRIPMKDANK